MNGVLRHYGLIIPLSAAVFFVNLGGPVLWDRDETRNARCTIEMMERQDWVVPYYNGQVRVIKPALMYWLMMSAVRLFGPSEFAFRFWSAVAGIGTVLATYHLGRRLFHPEVGLWGAVILATSPLFAMLSRMAKVDALLIFFDTVALLVFVCGTFRRREDTGDQPTAASLRYAGQSYPQSPLVVAAMFALMGLAVLGKGPIGVVLPTAVLGMFLLILRLPAADSQRMATWPQPALQWDATSLGLAACWLVLCWLVMKLSIELGIVMSALLAVHLVLRPLAVFRPFAPGHFLSTCWYMRPVTALVALLAAALPWHIWVGVRDFRWIEGFYLVHNFGRAMQAMEGHSGSGLLYYPAVIALGLAPWSIFCAPVLIDLFKRAWRSDAWRVGYVLLACWIGVYVGLFSLAQTKLPNYIAPAFPALALATACYLYHLCRSQTMAAPCWPYAALATLASTGLAILVTVPLLAPQFLPGAQWLGLVGIVPLGASSVCFLLFRRGYPSKAIAGFATAAVTFTFLIAVGGSQWIDRHQTIHQLKSELAQRSSAPRIAAVQCLEPSMAFYCSQNVVEFSAADGRAIGAFLAAGPERFVVASEEAYQRLQADLPEGTGELARVPVFLRDKRLVLVGHRDGVTRSAARTPDQRAKR